MGRCLRCKKEFSEEFPEGLTYTCTECVERINQKIRKRIMDREDKDRIKNRFEILDIRN